MKNRFAKHLIPLCCLTTASLSCIDEYTIPQATATDYQTEMVIEGRILAGEESVVHLTTTLPLNSAEQTPDVLNAQVYVIGQNGYRSEAAEYDMEKGCYVTDTRTLEANTLYAVEVTVDGDTFQSDFQPLLASPPIDEVTWEENEASVSIYVSTHGGAEHSPHLMWTFEEDWEIKAELDMRGNDTIRPVYVKEQYPDLTDTRNPYLYCWMHDVSRNILLHSTASLSENRAEGIKLHEIGIEDIRISYLYSILVKQWSLTDEAYQYYATMKRYTEEGDGLFTPILTDYQGNVVCTTRPQRRAHGYVTAGSVTTRRIFIREEDFRHMRSQYRNPYSIDRNWERDYNAMRAVILSYPWLSPWVVMAKDGDPWDIDARMYNWYCVDCRRTEGASKKRPDFWPNDHE